MKDLTGNLKKLLSQKQIKDCVEAMGGKISAQYSNSNPIFIGVLNGSFIFMADLLRSVTIDCEVDFIKVRSYSGKKSSGTIKLLKDISCWATRKRRLPVDDGQNEALPPMGCRPAGFSARGWQWWLLRKEAASPR